MRRRSDHPDVRENERLEFLGDSVVALAVSSDLFERFPDLPEGDLTWLRAALVCAPTLGAWAREMRLDEVLGVAEEGAGQPGGRNLDRLLASVFEAVVAVVYLERGLEAVRDLLRPFIDGSAPRLAEAGRGPKNRLQELTQVDGGPTPLYRVVDETGPPHARLFTVEVDLSGRVIGTGTGHTKQLAEKAAAEAAIAALQQPRTGARARSRRATRVQPGRSRATE